MNMPTHIRTKPNQVATRACVVLQTIAVLGVDAGFSICGKAKCEMGGAAKIAGPLVARKVQKQFKSDVDTLKRKLEAGAR